MEIIACQTLSPSDCNGDLTCDDCECRLQTVADVAENEEVVGALIEYLNGEAFCGATVDPEVCADYNNQYAGQAIEIMANTLSAATGRFCSAIYGC